jgi:hypothetical protein
MMNDVDIHRLNLKLQLEETYAWAEEMLDLLDSVLYEETERRVPAWLPHLCMLPPEGYPHRWAFPAQWGLA